MFFYKPLMLGVVIFLSFLNGEVSSATVSASSKSQRCFPEGFLFGSATAAYQVEGAWNEAGRTKSIWDDFCRSKKLECANVADDFFHRYQSDIDLMKETGLNSFRFSISWSRVMNWNPKNRKMKPNRPGIQFYHHVIDELRAKNIVPIVTLYHWDLPSELHNDLKPRGWLNDDIVDHFIDYASLVFYEYGSKIDFWSTFNEPWTFTVQGYGSGTHAPGFKHSHTNTYTVAHHVLLAHAKSVHLFRELKLKSVIHPNAQIGIVLNADYSYPLDPENPSDVEAAERKMQYVLGWFLLPIVTGDYPAVMKERAVDNIPEFTNEESELLKGSYDVLMLNHYSSKLVTDCHSKHSKIKCHKQSAGWERDLGVDDTRPPTGARLASKNELGQRNCNWFTGYPQGYLDTIRWMHSKDPKANILLTENGWCGNEVIDNQDQLWYYQTYLGSVWQAIQEGIPIVGYTAWSFVDNYEWGSFKPRFGLYYVNFTSETGTEENWLPKPTDLARIPRTAAKWYTKVAHSKCLDEAPERFADAVVDVTTLQQEKFEYIGVVSNFLVCAVFAPIVLAFVVTFSVLRRRNSRPIVKFNERSPLIPSST